MHTLFAFLFVVFKFRPINVFERREVVSFGIVFQSANKFLYFALRVRVCFRQVGVIVCKGRPKVRVGKIRIDKPYNGFNRIFVIEPLLRFAAFFCFPCP